MSDIRRRRNRLSGYDYSLSNRYFITICTCERRCLLGDRETLAPSEYAVIVQEAIENIGQVYKNVNVDNYVIMPNHIHMILVLMEKSCPDVSTIVRLMKRHVTLSTGKPIWQKSFHDHIIRNDREYRKIWEYIESNPAKWREDCYYIEDEPTV